MLKKCPICGVTRLKHAMKNHIINAARNELWFKKLKRGKSLKHYNFYIKHLGYTKVKKLII